MFKEITFSLLICVTLNLIFDLVAIMIGIYTGSWTYIVIRLIVCTLVFVKIINYYKEKNAEKSNINS